jgi:hypothetical protein
MINQSFGGVRKHFPLYLTFLTGYSVCRLEGKSAVVVNYHLMIFLLQINSMMSK